jgi:ABC-2 type transport system ATP-binding protein
VRRWMGERPGRTTLLTTHYMAEADEMCDRVAIINAGRVLACDSPANLKRGLEREVIFHLEVSPLLPEAAESFRRLPGVQKASLQTLDEHSALDLILDSDHILSDVVAALTAQQARILYLQKREPTLEDVFVKLVGLSMAEAEKEAA